MSTILKYVLYAAIILVMYFVAQGMWRGSITENTPVKEVVSQVGDGFSNMASDVKNEVRPTVQQ